MGGGPIFIVGAPRSGTTLLRDLLRSHPRLSFPPESQVLPWWYEHRGDPRSSAQARRLAADLLGSSAISQWRGLDLKPSELAHHRTFAGLATALFENYARREDKPRWGDKTPQYARHLPLLSRLWPDSRFIHVIRDGRDVACSWRDSGWLTDPYELGRSWNGIVRDGRRDGEALGPARYQELRYERLVADPESELRAVCAFVEEEYTPALLIPTRSGDPAIGAGDETYAYVVQAGSVGPWRTALTPEGQALFAAAAGELLEELGYPDVGPRRPPPTLSPTRRRRIARRLQFIRSRLTIPERVPLARQTLLMWRARLSRRLKRRV